MIKFISRFIDAWKLTGELRASNGCLLICKNDCITVVTRKSMSKDEKWEMFDRVEEAVNEAKWEL